MSSYQRIDLPGGPVLVPRDGTRSEISGLIRQQLDERRRNEQRRCREETCSCGEPALFEWTMGAAFVLGMLNLVRVIRKERRHGRG
jgi:hypothetical protein